MFDLLFHLPQSISFTLFSLRYAYTLHIINDLSRIFVAVVLYNDTQMYVNLDKLLALKTEFHEND